LIRFSSVGEQLTAGNEAQKDVICWLRTNQFGSEGRLPSSQANYLREDTLHFLSSASITFNANSMALGIGESPASYRIMVMRFLPNRFANSS
jgi:hypothetical protein